MSKEIMLSRRENGLTIRFLAQTLINDIVFPDQSGIKNLLSKAKVKCKDGSERVLLIDKNDKFDYYFLFHLEDFGSEDKSEIDLLLRQGSTLYAIEIKAFTNPNETRVKREIVRNYITLEKLSASDKYFDKTNKIITILLYSTNQHLASNSSASSFNYFNDDFLYLMDENHKEKMTNWNCEILKIKHHEIREECKHYSPGDWHMKIQHIASDLYFLTWDDVFSTLEDMNPDERFNNVLDDLRTKKDLIRSTKNASLLSRL